MHLFHCQYPLFINRKKLVSYQLLQDLAIQERFQHESWSKYQVSINPKMSMKVIQQIDPENAGTYIHWTLILQRCCGQVVQKSHYWKKTYKNEHVAFTPKILWITQVITGIQWFGQRK